MPAAEIDPRILQKVLYLQNSSFFSNLPFELLLEIARLGEEVHLSSQETLFEEKDPADGLYFVLSGELEVRMGGVCVNRLADGAVLGEIALLDGGVRTAACVARGNVLLLRFEPVLFDEIVEDYPEVARRVLGTLVERFRVLGMQLEPPSSQEGASCSPGS
jgi:CRP-like cAMP-binding protein